MPSKQQVSMQYIQEQICPVKGWHVDELTGKKTITHFQFGEKKCRNCNVFFKKDYQSNNCIICNRRISNSSRYKKSSIIKSLIYQIGRYTFIMGDYLIYNSIKNGWECECLGWIFYKKCYHLTEVKRLIE